ncbi:MAG: ABC transporter permease [Lentisphaeria bacterium]
MITGNPIFEREVKAAARDPKVIGLIIAFLALLSSILIFLWPSSGVFSLASDKSMEIFTIFLMSNLALIILLVPALTSPSLTTERENNSFDLIKTSLLTPGEMLRGKLMSSLALIVVVILVSMPIGALCSLSGGIGPSLLLRAYAVIAMAAITYGILGLALSALCRRTFTALMTSYLAVALLAGGTWLPYSLLGRVLQYPKVWLFIRSFSPFDAMYSLLFPARHEATQLSQLTESPYAVFNIHMVGMAILLVVLLVVFTKFLLAPPRPERVYGWLANTMIIIMIPVILVEAHTIFTIYSNPTILNNFANPTLILILCVFVDLLMLLFFLKIVKLKRMAGSKYVEQFTGFRKSAKRKLTWPFYLIDPLKRKKPIRFMNPVFVAEMRGKIFGKPQFVIWSLVGCVIVCLTLLILVCIQYADELSPDTVRWVAILYQMGIVAILAPAITSGSITDEISSRTMLMLRMTPITAVRVVIGKLQAAFVYVSIFLISSLPVLYSLADLEVEANYWRIGAWCAVLVLTTVTFITAGLCASAFSQKTSHATGISYCFAALICIVTLATELPGVFSFNVRLFWLTLNPVVAALRITSDELFQDMPDDLWLHNLAFLGGISLLFIILASGRLYYILTRRK